MTKRNIWTQQDSCPCELMHQTLQAQARPNLSMERKVRPTILLQVMELLASISYGEVVFSKNVATGELYNLQLKTILVKLLGQHELVWKDFFFKGSKT